MIVATILAIILLGWSVPDGVECAAFGPTDTPENKAATLEARHEFFEFYDWDGITEHQPVSECWKLYAALLVTSCDDQSGAYVVQDGDLSLWSISARLGISFGALLGANSGPGLDPDLIHVGDVINLP